MAKAIDLITSGNLKGGIQQLLNEGNDNAILLMSRFNKNERDNNMGLLRSSDYTLERNRILQAAISYCGGNDTYERNVTKKNTDSFSDAETFLLDISAKSRRRDSITYRKAQELLAKVREYKDNKTENNSYDISERRLKAIKAEIIEFQESINEKNDNSRELFVEKVTKLLKDSIPSYEDLQEAYNLSCGRGMKDVWTETQLRNRPSDNEVKISIAEKIEYFMGKNI